jgi:hypothetical protein
MVETLLCVLYLNVLFVRYQSGDLSQDFFCQMYDFRASEPDPLVEVPIDDGHQFAQVVCLKLPDNLELFSALLFAQIKVYLGQHSSH